MAAITVAAPVCANVVARKSSFAGARQGLAAAPARATVSRGSLVVAAAGGRQMWLNDAVPPPHLDGTLAGDYGFDPLGLGSDPEKLKYYAEAELMNSRWAMMAVAGICYTEATGIEPKWFNAGSADYDFPIPALLAIQFPVMGFLETKRMQGFLSTGSSGVNEDFPWDPLGLDSDAMKLKEIKNGRLAMIAFVGIVVQSIIYREGPIAALKDHIVDPFGNNMGTNIMHLPENLASL